MSIYYLGTFPPEYGGVTIKNLNLYNALTEKIHINKVDFSEIKRKNFKELVKLIAVIINPKNIFIVGVAGKNTRKNFCKLLYYTNRKAMKKSVILLMGGTAANDISSDNTYMKYIAAYKRVYVETDGMKMTLEKFGLKNVGYYPNGRFMPKHSMSTNPSCKSEKLKCIFFSYITQAKGIDLILNVAKKLKDIEFYFYGKVDEQCEREFNEEINIISNAYYRGIFSGTPDQVYKELKQYDVLLLPTTWVAEGVPGILVESKIAGIPSIVSNHNFNAEIISDNSDGIVLKELTSECLADSIMFLSNNEDTLLDMKEAAHKSAKKYYIENYVDEIIMQIAEGGKKNNHESF